VCSSKQISPIEWPGWYRPGARHFLEGMPFVGPHSRILHEAKAKLRKRDPNLVSRLWEQYENDLPVVKHRLLVFAVAADYVSWPNPRFIPTDRTPIVLGCIPGIWIDSTDIIDDVLKKLDAKRATSAKLLESVVDSELLDVFRCLQEHVGESNAMRESSSGSG